MTTSHGATPDTAAIAADARRVLAGNRQTGVSDWDGKRYDFVCPSGSTYPFQWLWDSAFHAIALLHVDPELAKQEIRCLLQGAQPDGFIPHMLLWEKSAHEAALRDYSITLLNPYFTSITQPPVIGRSIARIFEATGDTEFLREVLPPTLRYFRWLKAWRDPDDDSLIATIQPDESGLDASPKYDRIMGIPSQPPEATLPTLTASMDRLFADYEIHRGDPARILSLDRFVWEDVMVNAIYADGLRRLGPLCRAAGYPEAEAREFEEAIRPRARRPGIEVVGPGGGPVLGSRRLERVTRAGPDVHLPLPAHPLRPGPGQGDAAGRRASPQRARVLAALPDPVDRRDGACLRPGLEDEDHVARSDLGGRELVPLLGPPRP